jgi:phage-related baseplate assembly protein
MEACAYREQLLRAAINDAGLGTMLAFARGAALDHLAAFYGLRRLLIAPSDGAAPATYEGDDDLRARVQAAPELLAGPGLTGGGYRAAALTIAPELKDVGLIKREGGRVDVVLLARTGDGTVDVGTVDKVRAAFAGEDAVQLTDTVTVRSATIVPYAPVATVLIRPGPDPELVRAAAELRVRSYGAQRHRIGEIVYAQQIAAAASVGGAESALVDLGDIVPGAGEAAYMTGATVTVEVLA